MPRTPKLGAGWNHFWLHRNCSDPGVILSVAVGSSTRRICAFCFDPVSKLETSKLICCHPERLFSNAKDLRFADRHDQPKKSHSKVIKTYARKNGIKDDPTHG